MADQQRSKDELNQELIELLNELRVALPGVQVLFAFLCTTAATILLIAPSIYHRLRWREHDKEHMLVTANRLTITGSTFLALAMISVVLLITDLLFSLGWAILATSLIAVAFLWFWYGLALLRRAER